MPGLTEDEVSLDALASAMDELALESSPLPDVIQLRKQGLAPALARAVAEQLDLRERAKHKLPTIAAAGCLFSRQALEQATHEAIACKRISLLGLTENAANPSVLDLTTGLGADFFLGFPSWKGVGIEADEARARLLSFNQERLGQNVSKTIRLQTAEGFLEKAGQKSIENGEFGVIAIDPDRRPNGIKRAAHLAASQPNVIAWLPWLESAPCVTLIKASPMDDITALRRMFPSASLTVQTVDGEVKEVAVVLGSTQNSLGVREYSGTFQTSTNAFTSFSLSRDFQPEKHSSTPQTQGAFLWEAGAGLRKAGLATAFASEVLGASVFSERVPLALFEAAADNESASLGRWWRVLHTLPYKPKALQALLKTENITHAGLTRYGIPSSEASLRATLKLRDGGTHQLLFGEVLGNVWVWVCERV